MSPEFPKRLPHPWDGSNNATLLSSQVRTGWTTVTSPVGIFALVSFLKLGSYFYFDMNHGTQGMICYCYFIFWQ